MNSEETNFETVVIEGQTWAVTPGNENSEVVVEAEATLDAATKSASETESSPEPSSSENSELSAGETGATDPLEGSSDTQDSDSAELDDTANETSEPEFDPLHSLTSLLLGGAIEGTSQLVNRLQSYEEELRRLAAENEAEPADSESLAMQETELDRLRFAFVGMVLDAQSTFRRNLSLWARAIDRSTRVTSRVTRPVTNSFLFGPLQRRYDRLVQRGEDSLSRWVADGRNAEPHSRELAKMTYQQIIDEFIEHLAENPELQELITQQSLGLASEARDEVREKTVTADNLMEGLVRRILRRTPRAELPGPPPEVQRWANMTLDEYKVESISEDADDTES